MSPPFQNVNELGNGRPHGLWLSKQEELGRELTLEEFCGGVGGCGVKCRASRHLCHRASTTHLLYSANDRNCLCPCAAWLTERIQRTRRTTLLLCTTVEFEDVIAQASLGDFCFRNPSVLVYHRSDTSEHRLPTPPLRDVKQ